MDLVIFMKFAITTLQQAFSLLDTRQVIEATLAGNFSVRELSGLNSYIPHIFFGGRKNRPKGSRTEKV